MFSKNLKHLRNSRNMTQEELASKVKRQVSSISEWESGKYTPRAGVLNDIATIFNVNLSDLMNSDLTLEETISSALPITSVEVPIYGASSCGNGDWNDGDITGYYSFTQDMLPGSIFDYFGAVANGDSMIDAHIPNGSLMIFKKTEEALDGQIVACMLNGEAYTKRYKNIGGVHMLLSENSKENYEPIVLSEGDEFRVHGRLVKAIIDF